MSQFHDEVEDTLSFNDNEDVDTINSTKRKALYRLYVWFRFGRLGRGVRKVIPECVKVGIRNHFPDSNDAYMGHMTS